MPKNKAHVLHNQNTVAKVRKLTLLQYCQLTYKPYLQLATNAPYRVQDLMRAQLALTVTASGSPLIWNRSSVFVFDMGTPLRRRLIDLGHIPVKR